MTSNIIQEMYQVVNQFLTSRFGRRQKSARLIVNVREYKIGGMK